MWLMAQGWDVYLDVGLLTRQFHTLSLFLSLANINPSECAPLLSSLSLWNKKYKIGNKFQAGFDLSLLYTLSLRRIGHATPSRIKKKRKKRKGVALSICEINFFVIIIIILCQNKILLSIYTYLFFNFLAVCRRTEKAHAKVNKQTKKKRFKTKESQEFSYRKKVYYITNSLE